MINLTHLFANSPTVELIEPRDSDSHYLSSLRLLLRDNATGRLTELTIEADMLTLPDAPVLVWSVMEVDEQGEDLAAWWAKGDANLEVEYVDGATELEFIKQVSAMEAELPATWTITPDGQEVDLRGEGLFQMTLDGRKKQFIIKLWPHS